MIEQKHAKDIESNSQLIDDLASVQLPEVTDNMAPEERKIRTKLARTQEHLVLCLSLALNDDVPMDENTVWGYLIAHQRRLIRAAVAGMEVAPYAKALAEMAEILNIEGFDPKEIPDHGGSA